MSAAAYGLTANGWVKIASSKMGYGSWNSLNNLCSVEVKLLSTTGSPYPVILSDRVARNAVRV